MRACTGARVRACSLARSHVCVCVCARVCDLPHSAACGLCSVYVLVAETPHSSSGRHKGVSLSLPITSTAKWQNYSASGARWDIYYRIYFTFSVVSLYLYIFFFSFSVFCPLTLFLLLYFQSNSSSLPWFHYPPPSYSTTSRSIHLPPDWLNGSAFIGSHYILYSATVRTLNVAKIQGVSSKGCRLHYYWYWIILSNACILLFNKLLSILCYMLSNLTEILFRIKDEIQTDRLLFMDVFTKKLRKSGM